MTVEITSIDVKEGIVTITALDVSEENLQMLERNREDVEKELSFVFDTHERLEYQYLYSWLHRQKATQGAATWGEALNAVIGIITTISQKYRNWD